MNKIAFIVGHNETAQGAVSFTGQTEYEFNYKVARNVCQRFSDQNVQYFTKTTGYVKRVKDFGPDLIIELHFNAFSKKAYGCEALTLAGSNEQEYEAQNFINEFVKRFGIKSRGVKLLQAKNDRGFRNFNGLRQFKMFLFEPCFGNFKTKDSTKIIENWEDYANFLADYIDCKLGFSEIVTKSIITKMIEMIRSWF